MELYNNIIYFLLGIVWHDALVWLLVIAGAYFTIKSGFLQFRSLPEMIRLLKNSKASEKGISSLQAFLLSISVRVGTGNVTGTATAILFGGPGAIFWMWVIAALGAASAFVESTLAQIYKGEVNGTYVGGPAYYAEKGLGMKFYGGILALTLAISAVVGYPGIQSNIIASTFDTAFGIPSTITGIGIVVFLAWIIFGGVKRIAKASEKIVPIMCMVYLIIATIIIIANITSFPKVIHLIINSAFNSKSMYGGLIGSALIWGIRRGVYSNEAGIGSGAPAAAAAEVSHPVKQGLIQACSVYVDTLLICTATAFIILVTSSYNTIGADGSMLIENLPGIEDGTSFVLLAVDQYIPFGNQIMAIVLTAFAFTCMYGGYYQAEASIKYFLKNKSEKVINNSMVALKVVLLTMAFMGTQFTSQTAWNTVDVFGGTMAWMHMILIILLSGTAFKALKDYEKQKKQGLDPVFRPDELGIKNAEIWNKINPEKLDKTV